MAIMYYEQYAFVLLFRICYDEVHYNSPSLLHRNHVEKW